MSHPDSAYSTSNNDTQPAMSAAELVDLLRIREQVMCLWPDGGWSVVKGDPPEPPRPGEPHLFGDEWAFIPVRSYEEVDVIAAMALTVKKKPIDVFVMARMEEMLHRARSGIDCLAADPEVAEPQGELGRLAPTYTCDSGLLSYTCIPAFNVKKIAALADQGDKRAAELLDLLQQGQKMIEESPRYLCAWCLNDRKRQGFSAQLLVNVHPLTHTEHHALCKRCGPRKAQQAVERMRAQYGKEIAAAPGFHPAPTTQQ